MTTIAADLDAMATDMRQVGDVLAKVDKIVKVKDSVVGAAGDWVVICPFLDWVRSGFNSKKKPVLPEGAFEAMQLDSQGIWIWDRSLTRYHLLDQFHAIGSGAMAAKAAMHCGKTPREAVVIASLLDENTGEQTAMLRWRK